MKGQAHEWNKRMMGATIRPQLKHLSYASELTPKLKFPLPAISLGAEDCERIMKPALPSIKHGLGIAKMASTGVIFFPHEFGGFGIMDLHLEKLTEQTRYVVQHLRNGDSLGRRMKICLETTQLESGTNEPLEKKGRLTKLQYITPTILTDLISELWSLKAEIWLNHWALERGITIMDVVRQEARDAEQMAELNM